MRRKKQTKSMLLIYYQAIMALVLAFVIFAFFAGQWWFFDLFSHFVMQYAIISAVLLAIFLLYRSYKFAAIALIICLSQSYRLAPLFEPVPDKPASAYEEVRILQYNVHRDNKNVNEIARWIISQSENIDIVVLLEVNERWEDAINRLKWAYPYHISRDMRGGRDMVILSKLFVDELEVKEEGKEESPAIVIRGETTGREMPFVLYGIHPPPPIMPSYAERRNDLLEAVAKSISNENAPYKMLIGDFNTTRYSPYFKHMISISGLNDSNEGMGSISTWPRFASQFFGLAIDNLLVSDNILVEKKKLGPAMGSDHFPVMTTLKFTVPEGKV